MLRYSQQNDVLRYFGPLFTRVEPENWQTVPKDAPTRIQILFKIEDSPCEYTCNSAMSAMWAFNAERLNYSHFQAWCACYKWYGKIKGLSAIAEENGFSESEFIRLIADMRVTFEKLGNINYPTDVLLKCLEGR